jgi:bifunctional non-homologous end joining protein LigD
MPAPGYAGRVASDARPMGLSGDERKLVRGGAPPTGADAMKAVLNREPFSDPAWVYERKLDGIRCVAVRDRDEIRMLSRNDLDLGGRYPEIRDALAAQPGQPGPPRFAVDGEIVAFDGAQTSFARLAQRGHHPVPVFYYVFDLLWLDGTDVRPLALRSRKRLLRETLRYDDPLRFTPHRNRDGEAMFTDACRKGWEGVIAKRADGPYRSARSKDWQKFKCEAGQELVVGGFTAPRGSRTEFGALLLGYHDGGALRYAGKVGTGFDTETLRSIGAKLRALAVAEPPFADPDPIKERAVTWVRPELVAQVAFTEWTGAGRLRHPRFLGLRDDKPASKVVRES